MLTSESVIFEAAWRTLVFDHYDPSTGRSTCPAPDTVQDTLRRHFTWSLYVTMGKDPQHLTANRADVARLGHIVNSISELHPDAGRMLPDCDFLVSLIAKQEQSSSMGIPYDPLSGEASEILANWLCTDSQEPGGPRTGTVFDDRLTEFNNLTYHMKAFSEGRLMARTSRGSMAYVSEKALAGDKVCLFSGGPVAYVLRPSDNGTWSFVGETYVQGIMHGEAWPSDPNMLEEIVLC